MRTRALWFIVLAMVWPLTAHAGGKGGKVDWSEYIDKGAPLRQQPSAPVPASEPAPKVAKAKTAKQKQREARSAKAKKAAKAKAKRAKPRKSRK
jgi:hypothetical protein